MVRSFPKMDSRRRRAIPPDTSRAQQFKSQPKNTLYPEHSLVISLARSNRIEAFNLSNNFNGTTEVIDAVDGLLLGEPKVPSMKRGDVGCLLSHKKALEHARDKSYPLVMIFEDDITFPPDFNERLKEAMRELPENWHLLWLGGKDNEPSLPYSNTLKILNGSWGTFAYTIKQELYQYFIDTFAEEMQSSDEYFRRNHAKFNSFRTVHELVTHIGGVSDRLVINHTR